MARRSIFGVSPQINVKLHQTCGNQLPLANSKLTELLRCTATCLQSHTTILRPLSSLFDMFWQMSLHPEQADEHPSTHSIMSYNLYYRCISQYQEMIEGIYTPKMQFSDTVVPLFHMAPSPTAPRHTRPHSLCIN